MYHVRQSALFAEHCPSAQERGFAMSVATESAHQKLSDPHRLNHHAEGW